MRTEPPFARLVAALAVPAITLTVLIERRLLFMWKSGKPGGARRLTA